ncbi:hypothetical protein VTO73DRAFT_10427 [Trametes versicolor]
MSSESQNIKVSSVDEQVVEFLKSDPARQALQTDINNLGKNIDFINALFDKVMRSLQAFDHESSETKKALAPQWAAFRKEFDECVNESRDSATAASRFMEVYTDAVLGKVKDTGCNVSALIEEIEKLRGEVTARFADAKAVHNSFNNLSKEIKDFKHVVGIRIRSEGISGSLLEELKNASEHMKTLEKEVANIPDEVLDPNADFLGRVATLVPGMSKTLSMLSPTITREAFRPILSGKLIGTQMEVVRDTILKDIGNVAQSIKIISNIWQILRNDIGVLQMDFKLYGPGNASVADSSFLMTKIEASRAVCGALSQCLKLYVERVPAA